MLLLAALCADMPAQNGSALKPAPTSREALVRVLDALAKRSEEALVALVDGGSGPEAFFRAIVASAKAADAFREKMIESYGEAAWVAFQAPKPESEKRADMQLTMPNLDEIRKTASTWEATAENQGRFEFFPGLSLPFKQIRGGWCINGKELFADEKTLKEYTRIQNLLTALVQRYMKAIGHRGITAQDIDHQMGKDLFREVFGIEFKVNGNPGMTNRFDVNALSGDHERQPPGLHE